MCRPLAVVPAACPTESFIMPPQLLRSGGISRHKTLLELEPVTRQAVQLRNPYVDPLNYIQVETLRRLRLVTDQDGEEAKPLREVMALTINGIAAGLRNTG